MQTLVALALLFASITERSKGGLLMNALELLKQDHRKVKELFDHAKAATDDKQRKQIFDRIDTELTIHAHIEETVFYPEMEQYEELRDMVEEALQEHQEVTILLDEIETMEPNDDEFQSSLEELMENVEHHVQQEEDEMFPHVHELCDEATLEKLGQQLESAKGKQQREAS
jgi:hemerythrin superfamily protein